MKEVYIVIDLLDRIISAHNTFEGANIDVENQKQIDNKLGITNNEYAILTVPVSQIETPIQTKLNFL